MHNIEEQRVDESELSYESSEGPTIIDDQMLTSSENTELRRSQRSIRPLKWLRDEAWPDDFSDESSQAT